MQVIKLVINFEPKKNTLTIYKLYDIYILHYILIVKYFICVFVKKYYKKIYKIFFLINK